MADLFDWSSTPGSNTLVDGINIAEGCPAGNVNNAMRSIMALVRNTFANGLKTFLSGSAPLPEANGGTGQTTLAAARTAMGAAASGANNDITALLALTTALGVAQGGTGATTAADALSALGISVSGSASSGKIVIPLSGATFALTWRDHTLPPSSSSTYAYGDGHTFSSWARGWFNGDDGLGSVDTRVVSAGTSTAVVANTSNSGSAFGTLFAFGQ